MPARKKTKKRAPRVSVIIPAYNHGRFIRETIDSVLAQTFQDFEILVINNFSEDDTEKIIKSYEDPRIKIFNFRNHGVIAASRNFGIKKSRGEFVAFLDSDDAWKKGKLEKQMQAFHMDPDLQLCGTDGVFFPKKPGLSGRILQVYGNRRLSMAEQMLRNHIINSSAVIRKSALKKTGLLDENPGLRAIEDYDLWLKILDAFGDGSAMVVGKTLVRYRIHDSNVLATLDQIADNAVRKREFDKVLAVLNRYSRKKGLPFESILRKRIYQHARDTIRTRLYGGTMKFAGFLSCGLKWNDKIFIVMKYILRKTVGLVKKT